MTVAPAERGVFSNHPGRSNDWCSYWCSSRARKAHVKVNQDLLLGIERLPSIGLE
jgi:hypothetical protein